MMKRSNFLAATLLAPLAALFGWERDRNSLVRFHKSVVWTTAPHAPKINTIVERMWHRPYEGQPMERIPPASLLPGDWQQIPIEWDHNPNVTSALLPTKDGYHRWRRARLDGTTLTLYEWM